jgi:hypothetical protein
MRPVPQIKRAVAAMAAGIFIGFTNASASCGSAYCTINSDWTSESAITDPGSTLDLRYEYINQDRPQAGRRHIAAGEIARDHDEVSTANRNLLLTVSHTFDSNWGVSIVAPFVARNHFHVHNGEDERTPERWSFEELGDVRVVGRYQVPGGDPLRPITTGLNFGLKLPTGRTTLANADGDVAERTLQPGSGTTDAILGVYFHQRLPAVDSAWFAQIQVQRPLNSHEGFKPGDRVNLDLGEAHFLSNRRHSAVSLASEGQHTPLAPHCIAVALTFPGNGVRRGPVRATRERGKPAVNGTAAHRTRCSSPRDRSDRQVRPRNSGDSTQGMRAPELLRDAEVRDGMTSSAEFPALNSSRVLRWRFAL